MPIYEYRCGSCGEHIEKMQRITADPLVTCPGCGEDGLKRLVSQTSFVLKGSGWYVTDYKNSGGKAAQSDEKSPSSDGGGEGESSSTSTTSDATPTVTKGD